MPKMQTSFTGLVSLLAKNLYTSANVFIRELAQNAHDGCQRRLAVEPEHKGRIDITLSATDRTISFSDNGIGMDEADIHEYLSTIGRSGTATETAKLSSAGVSVDTIGQFGVGLLSAFVVAEQIDVFTRKLGSTDGFHWVSHGGDDYEVAPTNEAPDSGTDITITLKMEFEHFLREEEFVRALRLFSDFLEIPIYVNGNGPINLRNAPWHLEHWASSEESLAAHARFLEKRYPDRALLLIPINIQHPRARGALYVTDQPIPGVGASGTVDLYVRRMCIRLNDNELLPDWATFVRGIIDADLQPTAARDNVQRDRAYQQLRRALGERITQALIDLQQNHADFFNRLCNWHHIGIKGMALRDEAFFAAVSDHLPFKTNAGTLTLGEYLDAQSPLPSGRKPIYYFSFDGDETQFFQICSANNLVAINAGCFFDAPILRKYADLHQATVEACALDHLNSRQLYHEVDATTAGRFEPMLRALRSALNDRKLEHIRVSLRQFAPESLASVLQDQPGAGALERFEALMNSPFVFASVQELAAEVRERMENKPTELLVNVRNPFVQSLRGLADLTSDYAQEALAGLYYLALLNSQRRLQSETARQVETYMQARLRDSLPGRSTCSRGHDD